MTALKDIRVGCWNMNGLFRRSQGFCKLNDPIFLQTIKGHNIIGLVETHCDSEDDLALPGFSVHRVDRARGKRSKPSGGIAVFIMDQLKARVKVVRKCQSVIWLKLEKQHCKRASDLYIGIIYIPPENSTFCKNNGSNHFETIEAHIREYSRKGEILILGDLNARTGRELDYVPRDSDRFTDNAAIYPVDADIPARANQDTITNARGHDLIDMCIASRLRILNGRMAGDALGYFSCHKYNGSSSVDYAIASETLLRDILYFYVNKNVTDLSDHCMISVALGKLYIKTYQDEASLDMKPIPSGFKWDANSALLYQQALCNPGSDCSKGPGLAGKII